MSLRRQVRFWRSPALPGLELRRARYARQTFARHTHPVWSLGLVLEGQTRFELGEACWQAGAGDLVLIPPQAVHDCNPQGEAPLGYWMCYLDPVWLPGLTARSPCQVVWSQPEAFAALRALATRLPGLLQRGESLDDWRQGWLTQMAEVLACWPAQSPPADRTPSPWLARAQALLCQPQELSLTHLSQTLGLSPSYLNRRFGAELGLPPHRYQLQQRIELAKTALRAGAPIVQVAVELGFSDQSHFTRHFTAIVGATPAQYQTGL